MLLWCIIIKSLAFRFGKGFISSESPVLWQIIKLDVLNFSAVIKENINEAIQKVYNPEAQSSRGTKRMRDEDQIMTTNTPI